MALINCKNCNVQISDRAVACPKCGISTIPKVTFKCFECDAELEKGTKSCSNCGAEQEINQEPQTEIKKDLIISTSPASPVHSTSKKKNKILIGVLIGAIAVIILVVAINNSGNSASNNSINTQTNAANNYAPQEPPHVKTPEELKAELKIQEQANPTLYLTASGTMRENRVQTRSAGLFHDAEYSTDGYYIEGVIKNSASVAKFKDVHLRITFKTKTNTILDTREWIQYEYYKPNSTKAFSIHAYPPPETENWSIEISSAKAAN